MLKDSLIDHVALIMREVAAEFIKPRFRALSANEIDTKSGPTDLVTIADREAELAIAPRLAAIVPGSVVVGEEAAAENPKILDRLCSEVPVWLVDPVDGTANFVSGSPKFGVMVALVQHGETLCGWIYLPQEDVTAMAVRGGGATLDGVSIHGRQQVAFADASGDYSVRYVAQSLRETLDGRMAQAKATRNGHCSAYAYLDTARGEIDFVMQYLMSPWDHAAGTLMVREAGGAARFIDNGENYRPLPIAPRLMLTTGDADLWDAYRAQISD